MRDDGGWSARTVDRPRVLFVTTDDPRSTAAWSGTPHFVFEALRRQSDVDLLLIRRSRVLRFAARAVSLLRRRRVDLVRSRLQLRGWGLSVERRLRRGRYDLVFAPASAPLTAVRTRVPKAFWIDAVYDAFLELYHEHDRWTPGTIARGVRQERRALETADLAAYSSTWAQTRALELVGAARTRVLDYGPNLSVASLERIRAGRAARAPREHVTLLWIGKSWERKGGPLLLDAADRLAASRRVQVDLVGDAPETVSGRAQRHGSLSKDVPAQLRRLESLWVEADVFVLPTRADCTPIVLAEASAAGVPVVAHDVGGVGDFVRRRCVGEVLPLGTSASDWAEAILRAAALGDEAARVSPPTYDESLSELLQAVLRG